MKKFVDDLRGAIAFMRGQGAKKIILIGASLGGCASAKLAVELQADGLVVVASPAEIPQWGFAIEAGDVALDIPKSHLSPPKRMIPSQLKQLRNYLTWWN